MDLSHINEVLKESFDQYKNDTSGKNADYIPFLKNIPSELGALAIVTAEGQVFSVGDDNYRFAIESISKLCTLILALEQKGAISIKEKVGASPTGMPFNSIMALELHGDKPLSPLVNAGAISTVSLLNEVSAEEKWDAILNVQRQLGSNEIYLSAELNHSEQTTNFHNRAIAWLLYSAGYVYSEPMEACDVYTRQCSTLINVIELATIGATLANQGINPFTKQQVLQKDNVPYVLAEMMMEGMYDGSGEWAYNVGLPSKSGVGGGVVSVVPGVMGIAAFSPKLDGVGNSVRGQRMIQHISEKLNLSLFKV